MKSLFTLWKIILIVMVCLGLAGCGGKNLPASTAQDNASAGQPTPDEKAARKTILDALTNMREHARRQQSTTALEDGSTSITSVEYQPPERIHIMSVNFELIVIDQDVYTKDDSGWMLSSIDVNSIVDDDWLDELEQSIADIQYIGQETLDGRLMHIYQYSSTNITGDVELFNQTKIWIASEDGLPYKMVIDGDVLGMTKTGETGKKQALVTITIVYDANIKIEIPQ